MSEFNVFLNQNLNIVVVLLFVCLLVGYLFGSIPIAYLYCKAHGVNILTFGSGNPGSTNVGRALGKNHGRVVFILDILKIVVPVLIIKIIYFFIFSPDFKLYVESIRSTTNSNVNMNVIIDHIRFYRSFISIYTGLGGILGHNYPLFLRFRGGKGISCTMGAILSFNFIYALLLFLIYKVVTKITKYVSVGSLSGVTVFFISSIIFIFANITPYHYSDGVGYAKLLIPGIFLIWAFAIFRHRENLIRLKNGTESKVNE